MGNLGESFGRVSQASKRPPNFAPPSRRHACALRLCRFDPLDMKDPLDRKDGVELSYGPLSSPFLRPFPFAVKDSWPHRQILGKTQLHHGHYKCTHNTRLAFCIPFSVYMTYACVHQRGKSFFIGNTTAALRILKKGEAYGAQPNRCVLQNVHIRSNFCVNSVDLLRKIPSRGFRL